MVALAAVVVVQLAVALAAAAVVQLAVALVAAAVVQLAVALAAAAATSMAASSVPSSITKCRWARASLPYALSKPRADGLLGSPLDRGVAT